LTDVEKIKYMASKTSASVPPSDTLKIDPEPKQQEGSSGEPTHDGFASFRAF
jgi:hypothetical protein